MRGDAGQLAVEVRKATEDPETDPAAARLVARKRGPIDEADPDSARRQGSRGRGPGRSGTDDDH